LQQTSSSRRKPYDPATHPPTSKLLGVPKLEVNKTAGPIKQKLQRFAKDKKQAIEVCKLYVTDPLQLFPYYCLNHSSWQLSNNTEVTCRLYRVKPGKSLTSQDRHLYIKTHTKATPKINKSQIIT
jgi:hypothetical protein